VPRPAPPIEDRSVRANGVEFRVLSCGDGPLALCFHGFPDSAHTWRHLLVQLGTAGYRAVAPFQRGYAPTEVPADGLYQSGALSMDAIALHEALGGGADAVLIGHDWGAPTVYGAAGHAPERWRAVVSMAVPPGGALAAAFLTNLRQIKRSWYMFFFQHPLADLLVGANDLAYVDMLWADWSPSFDAAAELELLKPSLRDPSNLQAALGYYRARLGGGLIDPALDAVQEATQQIPPQRLLYLHGADDGCIGVEVAEAARGMVPGNVTIDIVDGAGHFLHLERPDEVNRRIVEFLSP